MSIRSSDRTAVDNRTSETAYIGVAGSPPLLLLSIDAASLSARRVNAFVDAESASRFVRFWFQSSPRSGVAAFWALPAPALACETEAVVIVRHPSDPGLVYPFSFPTMSEALRMMRSEMREGLHIGSFAIYYAFRVTFEATPDGDLVATPGLPPQFERPLPPRRSESPLSFVFRDATEGGILSRAFNAVRLRRWTWHEAPFAGFGSPRGRF